MRKLTVIVASVVASAAFGYPATAQVQGSGAPTPSHTISNPIVTRAEYHKVTKAMKMARVHRIFDTKGKQTNFNPGDPATQSREYRTGYKYGFVSVYFKKVDGAWVVTRKAAYWG